MSLTLCGILFTVLHSVVAHPANQTQIPNGANVLRLGVSWPAVGHLDSAGVGSLNSFGLAFATSNGQWTRSLCDADSDGDGYSNGAELGDPTCRWIPGDAPTRTNDITHPGFSDSFPSSYTSLTWRLNGPTAIPDVGQPTEGILVVRQFPKPWGTANFGLITTPWAKQYCNLSGALNATHYVARAWPLSSRPSFADRTTDLSYLPANGYVAVSDVLACGGSTYDTCAYSYSDPGTPQNTTTAQSAALYVDCRYRGLLPSTRLISPDPGRGFLQVYDPDTRAWVTPYLTQVSGAPNVNTFVCGIALGYNPALYNPVRSNFRTEYCPLTTWTCDPTVKPEYCDFLHTSTFTWTYWWECTSRLGDLTPASPGPALRALVVAFEHAAPGGAIYTEATFQALVASLVGIPPSEVVVARWLHNDTQQLVQATVYVNSTAVNPSTAVATVLQVPANLTILDSRIELVRDQSQPEGLPTEWMIDGVSAHEGVLKARYGPSGAWGLVQWDVSGAVAADVCARAGQIDPTRIPQVTTIGSEASNLTDPYLPADRYMIVSDPGQCADPANISSCAFVYSEPTRSRNATSWTQALYVRCQWAALPAVRLSSFQPCIGYPEIKPDGESKWYAASSTFPVQQMCELAGCPCQPGDPCQGPNVYSYLYPEKVFNQCNYTHRIWECAVDDLPAPPVMVSASRPQFRCQSNPFVFPWVSGEVEKYTVFQSKWGMTLGDLEAAIHAEYPTTVTDANITILEWTTLPAREQQYVNFTVEGDNPSNPVIRTYFDNFLRKYGLLSDGHGQYSYSNQAYTRSDPQYLAARVPRAPYGSMEFKLAGAQAHEGWLMARWPGGEWGYVSSSDSVSSTRFQTLALFVCNNTGNYVPNRIAYYTFGQQSTAPWSARNVPNASIGWSSTAYASLFDFTCSGMGTEVSGNEAFARYCRYATNIHTKSYIALGNTAMYFQCAVAPYQFRLLGAFKGAGIPEYFEPNTKQWLGFYASTNAAAVQTICTKFMQLGPVAGHTPTCTTISGTPNWHVHAFQGQCADVSSPIETCSFYWRDTNYGDNMEMVCHPPLLQTVPTGNVVRMLNAAIDGTKGLTQEQVVAMAAQIAGTAASNVVLSQWNTETTHYTDLIYISLRIVDLNVNIGVAMNAILANSSFRFVATDVRPMPVPSTIPEALWHWALEVPNPSTPYKGFVTVRPTAHYQYGIVCAPRWTQELTKSFCAMQFGASMLAWHLPPTFVVFRLQGSRETFVQDVLCAPNTTDLRSCSYVFMTGTTAQCDGTTSVLVDCKPRTATPTLSATVTVSPSRIATPSTTAPPTASATASLGRTASSTGGTGTPSRSASPSAATATASRSADTASATRPPTPSRSITRTRSAASPTRSRSASRRTPSGSGSASPSPPSATRSVSVGTRSPSPSRNTPTASGDTRSGSPTGSGATISSTATRTRATVSASATPTATGPTPSATGPTPSATGPTPTASASASRSRSARTPSGSPSGTRSRSPPTGSPSPTTSATLSRSRSDSRPTTSASRPTPTYSTTVTRSPSDLTGSASRTPTTTATQTTSGSKSSSETASRGSLSPSPSSTRTLPVSPSPPDGTASESAINASLSPTSSATPSDVASQSAPRTRSGTDDTPTASPSASAAASHTPTLPAPMTLAAPVLAAPVEAAVASSSVVGSLGAATQVARAVGAIGIASRCSAARQQGSSAEGSGDAARRTLDWEPPFPQSLMPGLWVGTSDGGFMRGTVVANFVVVLAAVCLVVGGAAAIVGCSGSNTGDKLTKSQSLATSILLKCQMPGALGLLGAIAIDGLTMAGATLLLAAPDSSSLFTDAALATVAFLLVGCIVAHVAMCVRAVVASTAAVPAGIIIRRSAVVCNAPLPPTDDEDTDDTDTDATASSLVQDKVKAADARWARWLVLGDHAWFTSPDIEKDPALLAASDWTLRGLGAVVTRFRGPSEAPLGSDAATSPASSSPAHRKVPWTTAACPWFLVLELLLTVVMGVAQALTLRSCLAALWLCFAVNAVGFTATIVLRPYSVPSKNALDALVNGLMFLGSGCLLAESISGGSEPSTLLHVGATCLAAAVMASAVSVVLTVLRIILVRAVWRGTIVIAGPDDGKGGVLFDPFSVPSHTAPLLVQPRLNRQFIANLDSDPGDTFAERERPSEETVSSNNLSDAALVLSAFTAVDGAESSAWDDVCESDSRRPAAANALDEWLQEPRRGVAPPRRRLNQPRSQSVDSLDALL